MKKILLSLLLASLGLAGCIAVPYDRGYGYGRHGHYDRDGDGRRDYGRRDYRY